MRTVQKASDLVTPSSQTIDGFAWQAQQKVTLGAAYLSTADYFARNATRISSVQDILDDTNLLDFALGACALSRKSLNYLDPKARKSMIGKAIDIKKLSDKVYLRALEQRYLLTCGDSIGGSMRNVVGQAAQNKLSHVIIERLNSSGITYTFSSNRANSKILTIDWRGKKGVRRLVFDKKSPIVGKSIDFILLKNSLSLSKAADHIACGELKGGIDPAGADEHWKTARAALNRIEVVFSAKNISIPKLFFIGAAIESSMATEIFNRLSTGEMYAAANLTNSQQLNELVDMLIQLQLTRPENRPYKEMPKVYSKYIRTYATLFYHASSSAVNYCLFQLATPKFFRKKIQSLRQCY